MAERSEIERDASSKRDSSFMLSEMPHELVAQILAILSAPDAARCMTVCRAWQDLVLMADAYWHDQLASDFGVEIADLQRQLQAEGKRAPPGAMAAYAYTFAQKFKWRLINLSLIHI